jgi:NDP-sugar pyrophosphorylase family protein
MKIILLATSQTKECYPLTVVKPNALLRVFNQTLLGHALKSVSAHTPDFRVVVLLDHLPLFNNAGLPENIGYDVIKDHSQVGEKISADDMVLDIANYYPVTSSVEELKTCFFEIKYSWDLLSCQEKYQYTLENRNEGLIEPNAIVKGKVSVGKGSVIKSGAYLEGHITIGENCTIGPNCFIRGTSAIGDICRVGNAVEIKNSILGNNVNVCHLSYVGDSIIGDNANLGAGFISSNVRHDSASVITRLNGEKIDTRRQKLGVVIGDGVHTGICTSSYPGRKIWPGLETLPGTIVRVDMEG